MKKLLLLIPPTRRRARQLGKVTLTVKAENGQASCKFRVEMEKDLQPGNEATCEYEITEKTDN